MTNPPFFLNCQSKCINFGTRNFWRRKLKVGLCMKILVNSINFPNIFRIKGFEKAFKGVSMAHKGANLQSCRNVWVSQNKEFFASSDLIPFWKMPWYFLNFNYFSQANGQTHIRTMYTSTVKIKTFMCVPYRVNSN